MPDDPKPAAEPATSFTTTRDDARPLEEARAEVDRAMALPPGISGIWTNIDEPTDKATTPAVQSDMVWGGPRWIYNASAEPVWVETKAQYWELMRRQGFRMKDQAESSTGTETEAPAPPPLPLHLQPSPPVERMQQAEAHIFGAITAVLKRYGLIESIWCTHCFSRNRPAGCRMIVTASHVALLCRCGVAEYRAPVGIQDMLLNTIANSAITQLDRTSGTIITPLGGAQALPAHLLQAQEAVLIRAYVKALVARGKEPRWHHSGCWSGDPTIESDACGMKVSATEIVIACRCRQLFERSSSTVQ